VVVFSRDVRRSYGVAGCTGFCLLYLLPAGKWILVGEVVGHHLKIDRLPDVSMVKLSPVIRTISKAYFAFRRPLYLDMPEE